MKRVQGIKLRWELEGKRDTNTSQVAPLNFLIDLEYKKYLKLCFWCYEKPLDKDKWLLQNIEEL